MAISVTPINKRLSQRRDITIFEASRLNTGAISSSYDTIRYVVGQLS